MSSFGERMTRIGPAMAGRKAHGAILTAPVAPSRAAPRLGRRRRRRGAGRTSGRKAAGAEQPSGPRNPWLPPGRRKPAPASIEDIFRARRARRSSGGDGGGGGPTLPRLPQRPDGKSWLPIGIALVVAVWLGASMVHRISPQEKGVVTTFGKYSRTLARHGADAALADPVGRDADVTSIQPRSFPKAMARS
jgi:membrane protease subunit HflK